MDRARKRKLRRLAIVDGERKAPKLGREPVDHVLVRIDRAKVVRTAVDVQHNAREALRLFRGIGEAPSLAHEIRIRLRGVLMPRIDARRVPRQAVQHRRVVPRLPPTLRHGRVVVRVVRDPVSRDARLTPHLPPSRTPNKRLHHLRAKVRLQERRRLVTALERNHDLLIIAPRRHRHQLVRQLLHVLGRVMRQIDGQLGNQVEELVVQKLVRRLPRRTPPAAEQKAHVVPTRIPHERGRHMHQDAQRRDRHGDRPSRRSGPSTAVGVGHHVAPCGDPASITHA